LFYCFDIYRRSRKVIWFAAMYNLRARVKAASAGSVRPQREVRSQALSAMFASQVAPSQALEILDDDMAVPETEVPSMESTIYIEAAQPPILDLMSDIPYMPVRDTPVDLEATVSSPVASAADTAAILVPTVGATPTRAPVTGDALACETAAISPSMVRDELTFQSRGQPLKRGSGAQAETPTLSLFVFFSL